MSSKKINLAWNTWSIRTQINFAMGSVGVLLLVISVISTLLSYKVGTIFTEFRDAASNSLTASDIGDDLVHVRLSAVQYRISGEEETKTEMLAIINEVLEHGQELMEEHADDPELAALFAEVVEKTDSYRSNFEAVALLQERRLDAMREINEIGPKALDDVTEFLEDARRLNDPQATAAATTILVDVMEGRLHLETYMLENEQEAFVEATEHFDNALKTNSALMKALSWPQLEQRAKDAQQTIFGLRTRADRIEKAVKQRNDFNAKMDELGPQIQQALEHFLEIEVDRQNTLGPAGSEAVHLVTRTIEILAAISVLAAIVMGWRIGRLLSGNLRRSVATMSELAHGNLDVEIEGSANQNELGEMARALEVFRENAQETRRLEAEKEAADQREKQLQAEQAERDRKAAEALQRRAEQERRQLEEAESFQQSVEAVIALAGEGDFTARVATESSNAALSKLGDAINTLLETVDTGVSETARVVQKMAEGDLTGNMSGDFKGAFARLQNDVNHTLASMNRLIGDLSDRGHSVNGKASELQSAAQQMSRRSEQNAASLEETSAALEEMSAGVCQVAGNIGQASSDAQSAAEAARAGAEVSREAVTALSEITEASKKMESIAGIIEDISFQINLLALNAGVESARAGEAGRGFAVVASEVRSLAQRSTEAVADISQVISTAREKVEAGVQNVGKTQQALDNIVTAASRVSEQMNSVSASMEQQSTGIAEINTAITTLDASTQANASSSEEVTAASSVLQQDAEGLSKTLSTFRTREDDWSWSEGSDPNQSMSGHAA